jgi:hypothetical protein
MHSDNLDRNAALRVKPNKGVYARQQTVHQRFYYAVETPSKAMLV